MTRDSKSFIPDGLGRRWFKNVSGQRIPPYAIMQIVGDPKVWQEKQKDESLSQYQKDLAKLDGLLHDVQEDNTNLLFCDMPSTVSETFQDAMIMAFNGPAWVEKDAIGRCSTGAFPSLCLVLGNSSPSAAHSFAIVKGKWFAVPEYTDFGAFTCMTATGETVALTGDPQAGQLYPKNARVMIVSARANNRYLLPAAEADLRMVATTPAPFVNVRRLFNFSQGQPVQVNLYSTYYSESGTLRIDVPGMYEIVIADTLVVDRALAAGLNRVPVSLGIVGNPRGNLFFLNDPTETVRGSAVLTRMEDRPIEGPTFVGGNEVPTENPTKFARLQYVYRDIVEIRNGPTKVYLHNTGSPYVSSQTEAFGNVKVRPYDYFKTFASASFVDALDFALTFPTSVSSLALNTYYSADGQGRLLVRNIDSDLDEWI